MVHDVLTKLILNLLQMFTTFCFMIKLLIYQQAVSHSLVKRFKYYQLKMGLTPQAGGTSGFKKSLLRKMRYLEYEWHCSDTIKALDNRNDKWPQHFSVVILFL